MPIYEFYCKNCHTIYNFFSRTINTSAEPDCPKCKHTKLTKQISVFAVTGRAKENDDIDNLPFDESHIEKAINLLSKEAESINEEDPRQAADLMRKLTNMTGLKLGDSMEEALSRMEKGEDPEQIEAAMGDLLENDDPFKMPNKKKDFSAAIRQQPHYDETLYDL